MQNEKIRAKFKTFHLPTAAFNDLSIITTTIKGSLKLKYGRHAYYFYNFKTCEGFCVEITHKDIFKAGFKNLNKILGEIYPNQSKIKLLLKKYHFGFNSIEQLALMTVPHAVTSIGDGKFIVNLWSYFGYLIIDCREKTVQYRIIDKDDNQALGSQQWFDEENKELYYMSYSFTDSLGRAVDPYRKVSSKILKYNIKSDKTEEIWNGEFADYMHDILLNKNKQYCVACEFGMFLDDKNNIIPSKVLVLDLKSNKQWIISRFIVAAHAQFDPDDPNIIYFSNHNFEFKHSNILKALRNASYDIVFRGPASVYKYRLTENGPEELGIFTEPDLFRLTNIHIFNHRSRKIIAAIGSPNFIFTADADSMKLINKIEVNHNRTAKHLYKKIPCRIGTISPSLDGEKLYVQTNKSFQVIDVSTGKPEFVRDLFFMHMCANHMLTSYDTNW
jgi:hypothetical protein